MPKVIVLDTLAQEGLDLLDQAPGIEYEVRTGLKGEELRSALNEFDGAICRSGVKITAESLEGNTNMKVIARAGVGTDNIDSKAAARHGIVVMNTPTGNTISTAEHAFCLMMALSRNVPAANQSLVEGRWDRKKYMGTQLADKTLGVVGLGRIGMEVAKRALAFEMRVIAYDPFVSPERAAELGIELSETVPGMLPHIDYLTVHTPLTPETKDMINAESIKTLKPGARLINCARGGIYNEEALVEGLKSGHLGGVALDVYAEEPCTDSPLFGMENVVATPHLGASTEEAQTQVAVEAVQLVVNYLTTGEIRHAVNVAPLDPKTLESIRGYLDVAYRLGLIAAQVHSGGVKSVKLTYRGEVSGKNTKLLTASFCAGFLAKALEDEPNIINSEMLLLDRGVDLSTETSTELGSFSSSITATIEEGGKSHQVGGTLFGSNMPRLILLDGQRLEAYLDGTLFIFAHNDVPGIIGKVGTIFGNHKVNIAQMAVGRSSTNPGSAVGVLNLDGLPSEEAVKEVMTSDNITSCKVIELPAAGEMPTWMR
ncbi:phosphoglycerate dehydrogenase [Blastopirellula marina]|uniref:D-3-phosphoglycerate dehydrogenase n=1 Tax=Blastopirellula marina TaxID=124 RepID=A0A2S8G3Z9_9BACT|nr:MULTISPECIES: phosphoglycerate dehydrogenase [Pirellulaceae]PQO39179.1 phosphoglycerate dehydrogenase [Blastopirellula marina]RCS55487.1 phosphoglycerate dehydrogenase [Bremerella cremea]